MTVVVSIIAVVVALPLVWVALLSIWSWRSDWTASRTHRDALDRISSAEISSRAAEWVAAPEWGSAPTIKELRTLVENGNYRAILKRWRHYHAAMVSACEWEPREGPPRTWILRDYLRVLDERAAA